jgi:DNA-binding winged helix-turn-helix (wHTH) protein/Tol biopolymer transport system component
MDSPAASHPREYRFGPFRVDTALHQLLRDDVPVVLTPKVFDLLLVLLKNRERVVDKGELLKQVWPDTFASEDSLIQGISTLRRGLGDDSAHADYIATVPKRGYRFVAPVVELPAVHTGAVAESSASVEVPSATKPAAAGPALVPWRAIAAAAVAVAVATAWWAAANRADDRPVRPIVLFQDAPPGTELSSGGVLSPTGEHLAFTARDLQTNRAGLWVRSLTTADARLLPDTEGAQRPFWSPDGGAIAFFADRSLKVTSLDGGGVRTLASTSLGPAGGAWGRDGTILFAGTTSALYAVPASGGPVRAVTALDREHGERAHQFPSFLPDGRHYVYEVVSPDADAGGIYLGSIDEDTRVRLLDGSAGVYAVPGHLLFIRERTLMAQPFDAARRELSGSAYPIASNVDAPAPTNGAMVSASVDGLVAIGGGPPPEVLTWFDRSGNAVGVVRAPVSLSNPEFVGGRAQLMATTSDPDRRGIWLVDLERGSPTRLIADAANTYAISPDGSRIAFTPASRAAKDIHVQLLGGTRPADVVMSSPEPMFIDYWSRDGRYLTFSSINPQTKLDLWLLPMVEQPRVPRPYLATPGNEMQGQVSPDGRWIAFSSDESGRWEVYVDSFPTPGSKLAASVAGGAQPQWREDGHELFYVSPDNTLMALEVAAGAGIRLGIPRALFKAPLSGNVVEWRNQYVPSRRGDRFLLRKVADDSRPLPIRVIVNWQALLPTS